MAGWTVLKVIIYSNNYQTKFGASKAKKVQERIMKEKAVAQLATRLSASRSDIISTTAVPDSLAEIELRNRGGLAHVLDETYFFFVKLELCCHKYFTDRMIAKYKWDTLKVLKQMVRNDPEVALEWDCLLQRLSGQHLTLYSSCMECFLSQFSNRNCCFLLPFFFF